MKKTLSILIIIQVLISVFAYCAHAEEKEDWEIYDNYLYYKNSDGHKVSGYMCDYILIDTNITLDVNRWGFNPADYFPEMADRIYMIEEKDDYFHSERYMIFLNWDDFPDVGEATVYTKEQIDRYIEMVKYIKGLPFVSYTEVIGTDYLTSGREGYDKLISGYVTLDCKDDTLSFKISVHSTKKANLINTKVCLYRNGDAVKTWDGFSDNSENFDFEGEYPVTESGKYRVYVIVENENKAKKSRDSMGSSPVNVVITENKKSGETTESTQLITEETTDTVATETAKAENTPQNEQSKPVNKNTGDNIIFITAFIFVSVILTGILCVFKKQNLYIRAITQRKNI